MATQLDLYTFIPFRATGDIEICFQCFNVSELHTTSSASCLVNITLKNERNISENFSIQLCFNIQLRPILGLKIPYLN